MDTIETKNLKKTYYLDGVEIPALRGVDFSVKKGEFVSIMGPSGCGKSTLLHLIGGVDRPTEGTVKVDGIDETALGDDALSDLRWEKIGFIFQSFNLLPTLTALENVTVPLLLRGPPMKEVNKRAIELLTTFGIANRSHNKPNQMSGGEQQRVAIARALINKPTIILGDEPTGSLDSKSGEAVLKLLKELNEKENVTILIVTHDHIVAKHSNRTIFLKDGLVIDEKKN